MGKNKCPEVCGGHKHLGRRGDGGEDFRQHGCEQLKERTLSLLTSKYLLFLLAFLELVIFITQDASYVVLYYCLTFYLWVSYFHNIIIRYWMAGTKLSFFASLSMNKPHGSIPRSASHSWLKLGQVT